MVDHMLTALVETLEEKGVLTQEEWEQKIKAKIEKTTQSYRELEHMDSQEKKLHDIT